MVTWLNARYQFFKAFYAFLKLELPKDVPTKGSALSPYVTVVDMSSSMGNTVNLEGEQMAPPVSMDVIKLRYVWSYPRAGISNSPE